MFTEILDSSILGLVIGTLENLERLTSDSGVTPQSGDKKNPIGLGLEQQPSSPSPAPGTGHYFRPGNRQRSRKGVGPELGNGIATFASYVPAPSE